MRLVLLSGLLFCSNLYAGSGPAELNCKGMQAPVTLVGIVPRSEAVLDLVLSEPAGELRFDGSNATESIEENFRRGRFDLEVTRKDGSARIQLNALKKSVKVKGVPQDFTARFEAMLHNQKPAPAEDKPVNRPSSPGVKMACEYRYSI